MAQVFEQLKPVPMTLSLVKSHTLRLSKQHQLGKSIQMPSSGRHIIFKLPQKFTTMEVEMHAGTGNSLAIDNRNRYAKAKEDIR